MPSELFTSPLVVMTSGNIINLDIYKCVEGFKEWMFIDCVDFEYGLNIRKHGYTIKQINTVFLDHELGNYEIKYFLNKKIFCDNHSALRRYYIYMIYIMMISQIIVRLLKDKLNKVSFMQQSLKNMDLKN